jgi:hypothetical protein
MAGHRGCLCGADLPALTGPAEYSVAESHDHAPRQRFPLAKQNYRQAKRQKEVARKARQLEKLQKRTTKDDVPSDDPDQPPAAVDGTVPAQ